MLTSHQSHPKEQTSMKHFWSNESSLTKLHLNLSSVICPPFCAGSISARSTVVLKSFKMSLVYAPCVHTFWNKFIYLPRSSNYWLMIPMLTWQIFDFRFINSSYTTFCSLSDGYRCSKWPQPLTYVEQGMTCDIICFTNASIPLFPM